MQLWFFLIRACFAPPKITPPVPTNLYPPLQFLVGGWYTGQWETALEHYLGAHHLEMGYSHLLHRSPALAAFYLSGTAESIAKLLSQFHASLASSVTSLGGQSRAPWQSPGTLRQLGCWAAKNLCWFLIRWLLDCMWRISLSGMMASSILHRIQVRLTGLKLPGSFLLPFLKIGATSASFQISGNLPCFSDALKMPRTGWLVPLLLLSALGGESYPALVTCSV